MGQAWFATQPWGSLEPQLVLPWSRWSTAPWFQVARPTGGVAIIDLGSKFGTHLDGRSRGDMGIFCHMRRAKQTDGDQPQKGDLIEKQVGISSDKWGFHQQRNVVFISKKNGFTEDKLVFNQQCGFKMIQATNMSDDSWDNSWSRRSLTSLGFSTGNWVQG